VAVVVLPEITMLSRLVVPAVVVTVEPVLSTQLLEPLTLVAVAVVPVAPWLEQVAVRVLSFLLCHFKRLWQHSRLV
jgi:hypothetical protein